MFQLFVGARSIVEELGIHVGDCKFQSRSNPYGVGHREELS